MRELIQWLGHFERIGNQSTRAIYLREINRVRMELGLSEFVFSVELIAAEPDPSPEIPPELL
jgi:hypothetical protein